MGESRVTWATVREIRRIRRERGGMVVDREEEADGKGTVEEMQRANGWMAKEADGGER